MSIKQVSVFLENKKGRLADVTRTLAAASVNIRALSLADTADFGVLRIVVNDPDRCAAVLKAAGFVVQETPILAVEVADRPGGLAQVLEVFERAGVNVEYMYAMVEKKQDNALVVFKVGDEGAAKAALESAGIAIASQEALRNL